MEICRAFFFIHTKKNYFRSSVLEEETHMKNIYFVPFGQDDCVKKPNSLVCDGKQVVDTINEVMAGRQIQPVIL